MVNRDQLAALGRGALTLFVGGVLLGGIGYAIGSYLDWWVVALLALAAIGEGVRWAFFRVRP